MTSLMKRKFTIFILCCVISSSLGQDINQSLKIRRRTGRAGYLNSHDNWSAPKTDTEKHSLNAVTSSHDSRYGHDSNVSLKFAILSELDDFIPDRTVEDKYSYSPGGFYIPHEREAKLNYHFAEVADNDRRENDRLTPDEVSPKDSNSKIITSSSQNEAGIIVRPTFLSVLKKAFLNPLVLISIAAVPLAFIIEMIIPYFSNIFSGNMLPSVATTIASGFGRSFDGDMALHVEQIMDVMNEFGVKALEDPKCLQRFICQGVKSQSDTHSEGFFLIQKIVHMLENSVDDEMLDRYGLKPLFNSVQAGDCESLVCNGSSAYAQKVPLFEKIFLLASKAFNMTEKVQ
ncbi:hypothetical protein AVEN_163912-1 [Araneus ventricosus]|uniref:Uncharacterized protein n=1 Tax=Araneus ventricosus TaxID=182803 RepID=A0A4Y2PGQ1_ARAVE|nr:hypothetical protein AVEN_163912-1 [Araneus ventricosus]